MVRAGGSDKSVSAQRLGDDLLADDVERVGNPGRHDLPIPGPVADRFLDPERLQACAALRRSLVAECWSWRWFR